MSRSILIVMTLILISSCNENAGTPEQKVTPVAPTKPTLIVRSLPPVEVKPDPVREAGRLSNWSTAGANIQVAANAIIQLASDIFSIWSIVDAADYGTDLYDLIDDIQNKISESAYCAEKISFNIVKDLNDGVSSGMLGDMGYHVSEIEYCLEKLLFLSDKINSFSRLVLHLRASNPLISTELVQMAAQAGTDSNNAVALLTTALTSAFNARSFEESF